MRHILKQPYKQFFGTLANQVRLDIVELLLKSAQNVSSLTQALPYEQSTISHSLKRLALCGFVTVTKKGKERIYTLNTQTIKPLFTLMQTHMDAYCKHIVAGKHH